MYRVKQEKFSELEKFGFHRTFKDCMVKVIEPHIPVGESHRGSWALIVNPVTICTKNELTVSYYLDNEIDTVQQDSSDYEIDEINSYVVDAIVELYINGIIEQI